MKYIIYVAILISVFSCKTENIDGILIGNDLLESQTHSENKSLDSIVKLTLQGDYKSLRRLNHFPCNGGASCYDKGFLISQIIYRLGESQFIIMVDSLDKKELYGMEDYIDVGLEYGDNNHDGKMDNKNSLI